MHIDQYVFSQSYLKNANFDLLSGSLTMQIEAYISMEHPGLNGIFDDGEDVDFDVFYRVIELCFVNVQYIEYIHGEFSYAKTRSDKGCINCLKVMDVLSLDKCVDYDEDLARLDLHLKLDSNILASFTENCEPLEIAFFHSSSLAFLVGYSGLEITEIEELI